MDATVFNNVFVRIWKGKSAKCPKVINLSPFAYLSDGIYYRLENASNRITKTTGIARLAELNVRGFPDVYTCHNWGA